MGEGSGCGEGVGVGGGLESGEGLVWGSKGKKREREEEIDLKGFV